MRDLAATMRKLGATSLRVSPRNLLDPKDIKAEIVFDRGGRRYVVRCGKWPVWLDNLRAAERAIYYLHRAIEEYGVTTSDKALTASFELFFAPFEALPDDTVLMLGTGEAPWWDVLGIRRESTRAEAMNAYRALAKVHHPDAGGDPELFKRLRRAYEQAMTEARHG